MIKFMRSSQSNYKESLLIDLHIVFLFFVDLVMRKYLPLLLFITSIFSDDRFIAVFNLENNGLTDNQIRTIRNRLESEIKKTGNLRGFNPVSIHDEAWGVQSTIAGTGDDYNDYSECHNNICSDIWNAYVIK